MDVDSFLLEIGKGHARTSSELSADQAALAGVLLIFCRHIMFLGNVSVLRSGGRTTLTFVIADDVLLAER